MDPNELRRKTIEHLMRCSGQAARVASGRPLEEGPDADVVIRSAADVMEALNRLDAAMEALQARHARNNIREGVRAKLNAFIAAGDDIRSQTLSALENELEIR